MTSRAWLPAVVAATAWLAWFGLLQWSVVRFRVPIVLVLTAVTTLLAWWLIRRVEIRWPPWCAPVILLGSVVITLTVPLFSYLRDGWLIAALSGLVVGGIACAALLFVGTRRAAGAAFGVAVGTHLAVGAVAILGDRAPRIDVWVVLQQGADALGRGDNIYSQLWVGSPGVRDIFPYLPWMGALTAPGRWIAGDVRWALLAWSVALLAGIWALAGGRAVRAGSVAAVLVLAPGTLTQIDQAWTEPVLAALIVWWAVLVHRGRPWWAVVPLALACASKQHLALLAPVLLAWPGFGWRRTLATGGLTGVLVLPWLVADPRAFVNDTVVALVEFPPIRFANTWYLVLLNEHGVELPFAASGALMLVAVLVAAAAVHRRAPDVDEVLRWLALVLVVASLVNKQAFYNQFWLVAVLVAASVAAGPRHRRRQSAPAVTGRMPPQTAAAATPS
ncbi:MAG: hypothetical protein ACRCYX_01985 [Dermatophilaceae bacterium]